MIRIDTCSMEGARQHIEHIIYYDGPLLALAIDMVRNLPILTYWVDCDSVRNVWVDLWLKKCDLEGLLRDELTIVEGFSRATRIERYETHAGPARVNQHEIEFSALTELLPTPEVKLNLPVAWADDLMERVSAVLP